MAELNLNCDSKKNKDLCKCKNEEELFNNYLRSNWDERRRESRAFCKWIDENSSEIKNQRLSFDAIQQSWDEYKNTHYKNGFKEVMLPHEIWSYERDFELK